MRVSIVHGFGLAIDWGQGFTILIGCFLVEFGE